MTISSSERLRRLYYHENMDILAYDMEMKYLQSSIPGNGGNSYDLSTNIMKGLPHLLEFAEKSTVGKRNQ